MEELVKEKEVREEEHTAEMKEMIDEAKTSVDEVGSNNQVGRGY